MRLEIHVGDHVLVVRGLDVDDAPLEIVVRCVRCRGALVQRIYHIEPNTDARQLRALAEVNAALDGLRSLAHQCGERN